MKIKFGMIAKAELATKGMPILESLLYSEGRFEKLVNVLRENGFEDVANLASDFKHYIPELKKVIRK